MSAADSAPSRLLTTRNLIAKPNILLIASALLALTFPVACNRKQAPQSPGVSDVDPLNRANSTRIEPRHFLHKTFPVKKHAEFVVEVPPHAAIPHLQGNFRSFISQPGAEPITDETADVDCLILNADQYNDFTHGRSEGTALYSTGPTHNHEVDYHLPPTHESSDTYHVVFRRVGSAPVRSVEADFTLSFGY
jgi:hypothetical protein